MKQAKLSIEVAGRKVGSIANVVTEGERTFLLEDAGGQFSASRAAAELIGDPVVEQANLPAQTENVGKARQLLELQGVDGTWDFDPYMHGMFNGMELALATVEGRATEFRLAPEKWRADSRAPEPLVDRLQVDDETEKAARLFYDNYNAAVGGVAWNGDALPTADEFFEDPVKQKQANAWRTVAGNAVQLLHDAGVLEAGPEVEAPGEEDEMNGRHEIVFSRNDEGGFDATRSGNENTGGPEGTHPDDHKEHLEENLKAAEEAAQQDPGLSDKESGEDPQKIDSGDEEL